MCECCKVVKWEYKVEWVSKHGVNLEDVMNEFGEAGWELAAVAVGQRCYGSATQDALLYMVTFKRPVGDPANDIVGLT